MMSLLKALGAVLFVAAIRADVLAQCKTPQESAMQPFVFDMMNIFRKAEEQTAALLAFQQKLIVPGERVGSFSLKSSRTEIESQVKLEALREKTDEAYEHFLPEGYIPERHFAAHTSEKITFAFSVTNQELKEILVMDAEYKLASGVEFGSSLETVKKVFPGGKELKHGKKTYWISEGISFVFDAQKLTQIVVFSKK